MMDVMGRGGVVTHAPARGAPDDWFGQSWRGRAGGRQGKRRESLIEAVNHSPLTKIEAVSLQRDAQE